MKSLVRSMVVGMMLAGGLPTGALYAEGEAKALPTLLIKGEIVSVDTSDPAATLVKVKDRYGFETPIYLQAQTQIMQGEASLDSSALAAGSGVEVEYNFDVNTAKRHAVSVKVAAAAAEAAPAAPAMEAAPAPAPEAIAPPADSPAPAAPAMPADSVPPESAPATE